MGLHWVSGGEVLTGRKELNIEFRWIRCWKNDIVLNCGGWDVERIPWGFEPPQGWKLIVFVWNFYVQAEKCEGKHLCCSDIRIYVSIIQDTYYTYYVIFLYL